MAYDNLERCIVFLEDEEPSDILILARAELTHAREALVVLEKVARARHLGHKILLNRDIAFETCVDHYCTEARRVMGKI